MFYTGQNKELCIYPDLGKSVEIEGSEQRTYGVSFFQSMLDFPGPTEALFCIQADE